VFLSEADGRLTIGPAVLTLRGREIASVQRLDDGQYTDSLKRLGKAGGPPIVDFGEHLVTPAFINAHTHLALAFLRGHDQEGAAPTNLVENLYYAFESRLTPEDVRAFARMGAYESLLNGVGLVWDHYYHGDALAEALLDTGLGGVVAPTLQDLAGPGKDRWEQTLETTVELARSTRHGDAGVFAAVGPHATDTVSGDLWKRAAACASKHGLPVHSHCAQSLDELRRVTAREGKPPMAWLQSTGVLDEAPSTLLVHCLYATRAELEALDAEKQALAFCPYSQLVFGFPADVGLWSELGVRWLVATDCAASNDSMNVQKELRFAAGRRTMPTTHSESYSAFLRDGGEERAAEVWAERNSAHGGLARDGESEQLLSRVWDIPGRLHPKFRAGVIAAGALANLVVWNATHPSLWPSTDPRRLLAMGDTTGAIHAMFVAGKPVGRPGDFHASLVESDDYRDAHAEATQRLWRLMELPRS